MCLSVYTSPFYKEYDKKTLARDFFILKVEKTSLKPIKADQFLSTKNINLHNKPNLDVGLFFYYTFCS